MKKLNNRQNQVKSLDFSNHHNFLYKQGLQKSPQLSKGVSVGQTTITILKDAQKQEVLTSSHMIKKTTTQLMQQQQFGKLFNGTPYAVQIDSTVSFQQSPSKTEMASGSKNFRLKLQNSKPVQTNKPQKLKMGMHKKAASMISSQLPSGIQTITHQNQMIDYVPPNKHSINGSQLNGLKFSMGHSQMPPQQQQQIAQQFHKQSNLISSQSSFHDYMSNNNNDNKGQDHNQKQTLNKSNVQHILLNNQGGYSQQPGGTSMSTHTVIEPLGNDQRDHKFVISQTFDNNHNLRDIHDAPGTNIMSFDNRGSTGGNGYIQNNGVVGQNQSQRVSILSSTAMTDTQASNAIKSNKNKIQAYRSHTNSFKTNANQIAVKHPQLKHVKAPTNQNSFDKGKKNLQVYHQRTFSENYQQLPVQTSLVNGNILNTQINGNSHCTTGQSTNRNFKELLKASGQGGNAAAMINNEHHMIQQFQNINGLNGATGMHPSSTMISMNSGIGVGGVPGMGVMNQMATGAKTTIGSSRQSVHSSSNIDEKDIMLLQYNKHQQQPGKQEKINELKNIYDSMMKEQLQNTKQELKLIQQQFGGPSRKVLSNNSSKLNAQTQSYRASNYMPLGSTVKGASSNIHIKNTPKPVKHKSNSKSSSYKQSQNTSAHGNRNSTTNGGTQYQNQYHLLLQQQFNDGSSTEKIIKKKALNVMSMGNGDMSLGSNIKINLQGNVAAETLRQDHSAQVLHRRSASDGNSTFISLTGRDHNFGGGLASLAGQEKNSFKNQSSNVTIPSNMQNSEVPLHIIQKQRQSKKVLLNSGKDEGNAYQNNTGNSHKMLKNSIVGSNGNHQRHNSYQVGIDQDRILANTLLADATTKPVSAKKHPPSIQQNQLIQPPAMHQNFQEFNRKSTASSGAARTQNSFRHASDIMIEDQSSSLVASQGNNNKNPKKYQEHNILKSHTQNQVLKPQQVDQYNIINFSAQQNQKKQSQLQTSQTQYLMKQQSLMQPSTLRVVEERVETQDSIISDPNLSPRTKINHKLIKKIKLAFQKTEQPPATSSEYYKIGKIMGKGAFGKVNLAIHRLSEKFVAVKSINKQFMSEESSKRKVMQEFNILRRTRHKNIVRLYESFETAQHIVFVMEVCGAGDLLTYVRRRRKLKEDVAKHIFRQVIEGLSYCHSKNVLHRDIKLDNILLSSEGDVKICDFGVSKLVRNEELMTEQCGTPAYIAPEVFENKGYQGYASDIWSAGVVLYAMLYGTVPFKASNMTELQKQITKCQTTFKDEISTESISLLKGILERDPSKRFTVTQILNHPWILDCPSTITVFTDQEKDKVRQEFAYYNFKNDNANVGDDNGGGVGMIVHTDPFTEEMLNSTQNSLFKNNSTKSVVLAPFNSTRSHIDENFHLNSSIQELMIDKKNLKFAPKVREVNRQYEANNNAELDNGVYHQDDEEEENGEADKNGDKLKDEGGSPNSIETSFGKDDDNDSSGNKKEAAGEKKKKKKSEWQKIEQQLIENQKTEEDLEDTQNVKNMNGTSQSATGHYDSNMVVDSVILDEIQKSGFNKKYVKDCLMMDELNYATAFYYLLTITKEY